MSKAKSFQVVLRQALARTLLTSVLGTAPAVLFAQTPPTPPPEPAAPALPSGTTTQPPARSPEAEKPAAKPSELAEAVLLLRDGRSFTGFLVSKDDDKFVLRIAGIDTTFEAAKVERYRILEPVLERYARLRASIDDNDVPQLIELIDFLISREKLDEALKEAQALRQRQPANPDVRRALERVQNLVDLKANADEPDANAADGSNAESATDHAGHAPLMTPEQVALAKVYEVDLEKDQSVVIPRSVAEAVLQKYAESPLVPTTKEGREALIREGPGKILDLMFRLRAREFYPQVKVVQTPESIRRFRDEVQQTLIIGGCATSGCHNSATTGGRLVFSTNKPASERTSVTNFYILNRFRTSDGKGLIDTENPERSALIQLGLPRDRSLRPHPAVIDAVTGADLWKPTIKSSTDRKVQNVTDWVNALYLPRPQYDVGYKPARPFEPQVPQAGMGSGTSSTNPPGK